MELPEYHIGPSGPNDTWREGDYARIGPFMAVPVSKEQAEAMNQQLAKIKEKESIAELTRVTFSLFRACVKCGFVPKVAREAATIHFQSERDDCSAEHGYSEHMDRCCQICHFTWAEHLPDKPWSNDGSLFTAAPGPEHNHGH